MYWLKFSSGDVRQGVTPMWGDQMLLYMAMYRENEILGPECRTKAGMKRKKAR